MNDIKKLEQEIIDIKEQIKNKETEIPEKDGKYWADILQINPERSNELSKNDWDKLNGWDWRLLLIRQPQLAKYCKWDKLDGNNWCWLLRRQPQLIEYCNLDKLNKFDWEFTLREQPHLIKYYDCDKLDENKCMNEENWYRLLKEQPQLKEYQPKEYQTKDMQIKVLKYEIEILKKQLNK